MSEAKQPKPFLKRGTRKYLSNATVRSLNQKPNIVDFGEGLEDEEPSKPITHTFKKDSEEIKVEIKTNYKPPIKKDAESRNSNIKAKQNKAINEEKNTSLTNNPKKKSATVMDDYIVVKNNKKETPTRESNSREKSFPAKVSVHSQPKVSMVSQLKRQEEYHSEDDENSDESEEKKVTKMPIATSSSKQQTAANSRKINVDLEVPSEKINFNSDSEEQQPKPKVKGAKPQIFPKPIEKKSRWEDEEEQKPAAEQPKGPSKILQKYYKKQPEVQVNVNQNLAEKKLTIADISRQLKEDIFNELLAQKHSDFTRKLDELHTSIQKSKKQRESLEESSKQLAKEKEQFEKDMQRRRKEFEEKINAENSKLTREKRYMKDHQTNGKVDWKVKNQVEELRMKLDQSENEKKKIKADLSREVDRLKKKLEEQEHQTDLLKGQIRCIEMEKLQLKERAKQVQKKVQVNRVNNQMVRYWQDAPTFSYISSFFDDNFTLISLEPRYYNYDNLEYYQYYNDKSNEIGELTSEKIDNSGSKIIRKYKSGKEETEFVSKSMKESFPPPFKFTIVHHANGDIKMILPEGIHIYYDNRNQITEWKINPDKIIHNFHKHGQIEMKLKTRKGEIKQTYKGSKLMRMTESGDIQQYRRSKEGEIMSV